MRTTLAALPRVRFRRACSAAVLGARTWSWWRRRGLSSRREKGPVVPAVAGDTPLAPPRPSANEAPKGSQGTESFLASPLDSTPPAACDNNTFGARKGYSYNSENAKLKKNGAREELAKYETNLT